VRARATAGESEALWTATILHELRQPLSVVVGYARLMQRRESYDPHAVESIVAATQRLGHLVDRRPEGQAAHVVHLRRLAAHVHVQRPVHDL